MGAIIVFATYVVKEGFRDAIKARLDGINNAETVYAIREDNSRANASRISATWHLINAKTKDAASPLPAAVLGDESDLLDETSDALNSSFSNLFALERAARDFDARDIPDLTEQHKQFDRFTEDYEAIIADDDYFRPDEEYNPKEIAEFQNDAVFNLTRNDLIGTHIIELMKEKITRDTRDLRLVNILSYVLYAAGWSLALLGRMSGIEDSAGE